MGPSFDSYKMPIPWNTLIKYAPLLTAFATLFAALVALYLGSWRDILRKPKLKLYFSEKKEKPYFHKLAFGEFPEPIDFVGQFIYFSKPGFNARVKIYNKGKTTAKNVLARVEKINLKNSKIDSEEVYHPTTVKWSGENQWGSVDIVPKSHFFLDVFWSKNENSDEIIDFNYKKYRQVVDRDMVASILNDSIIPSEEIY